MTHYVLSVQGSVWSGSVSVQIMCGIGSDNGLSPGRRQAIIWTNAGILLIRTLGTNFSEILGEIHSFSFSKMPLKMSSAKWRPFCLGLNVLTQRSRLAYICDRLSLVPAMACHLFVAKPLSQPMMVYFQLDPWGYISVKYQSKYNNFHTTKCIWNYRLWNGVQCSAMWGWL